ncbi:MAG: FAD-dependent oxidoreductase [Rhizomicrobium sp.]
MSPESADVIVLGSGAAGLTAALTAAVLGMQVVVIEKGEKLGGTSAMSGAGTWIPANHHAHTMGIDDSIGEALDYMRAAAPDGWRETEDPLWQSFLVAAPRMLELVEKESPTRFEILSEPDPMLEVAGARKRGRMLSTKPMRRDLVGRYAKHLRRSTQPHALTYEEMIHANFLHKPLQAYLRNGPKILWRKLHGIACQGTALITGLLRGCLDHGCRIEFAARAVELIQNESGAVVGVIVEKKGQRREFRARRGVVIATGGFEWDRALFAEHFPGPVDFLCSPSTNEGDGLRMAVQAGAVTAHMDQANLAGALPTWYEGRLHGVPLRFQADPHAIVVNQKGRRFGNECDFNFCETLVVRDPQTQKPANLPAWVIADANFLRRTPPLRFFARHKPGWLIKAPTLTALAEKIGLPASALQETVARYNAFCAKGRDEDFQRGEHKFERYWSGGQNVLGSIQKAPFVATPFNISTMGTKGGPRTNADGQVLRADGSVIAGLYCAGNAMANPIGTRAVGAGTTIGPCMTWGYICAQSIATTNRD